MSRYTPKRLPAAKGGGPARPIKPATRAKPGAKPAKRKSKPTGGKTVACPVCQRPFRTEEAVAIHMRDAHGQLPDPSKMAPLSPGMVRCPQCAAPVRKRNLEMHLRAIHGQD